MRPVLIVPRPVPCAGPYPWPRQTSLTSALTVVTGSAHMAASLQKMVETAAEDVRAVLATRRQQILDRITALEERLGLNTG